jgi:small subunit ribosomal protein S6
VPLYESVYIARPDISSTQVEALTADMTKIVEDNGGKVTKEEYWGLKSLAYRIKKNRKGHYSLLNIDAPPAALTEMERNMRIHEDILRYMSIRVDEHEEGPSAMMQSKSSRDDRDRDRDRDRGRGRDDDSGPEKTASPVPAPASAAAAAEVPAEPVISDDAPASDSKDTEE